MRLTTKAEPQPMSDAVRDSGNWMSNGCWLRRFVRLLHQNLNMRFGTVCCILRIIRNDAGVGLEMATASGVNVTHVNIGQLWEVFGTNKRLNRHTRAGLHHLWLLAEIGLTDTDLELGCLSGKTCLLYRNGDIAQIADFQTKALTFHRLMSYKCHHDYMNPVTVKVAPKTHNTENHAGESKHQTANRTNDCESLHTLKQPNVQSSATATGG